MSDGTAPRGYSGSPHARKLGLKPGLRVALDGAPLGWTLDDPPVTSVAAFGGPGGHCPGVSSRMPTPGAGSYDVPPAPPAA